MKWLTAGFARRKFHHLYIMLALLAGAHSALAQVTNLSIAPVGQQSIIYWPASNTTNYILQTVTNLSSSNWVTASNAVAIHAAVVPNAAPAGYFRLSGSATPTGMALIPGGSFLMGNFIVSSFSNSATNDPDIVDATPITITVSAFYMDVNLVSWSQWTNVYYDLGPSGFNAAFATGAFPYTSPVGYFAPNAYGLYDMAGNALEWCWDWYGTPYGQPSTNNPTGPATGNPAGPAFGGSRVLRGGAWDVDAHYERCAFRNYGPPTSNTSGPFGFRCVKGL